MGLLQDELYAKLDEYTQRAVAAVGDTSEASKICFVKWKENNDYVMPWAPPEDPSALGGRVDTPHPDNCGMFTAASKTKVPGFMSALPRGKGNYRKGHGGAPAVSGKVHTHVLCVFFVVLGLTVFCSHVGCC